MTVILIISAALVAVGLPLYIHHRLTERRSPAPDEPVPDTAPAEGADGCCGLHLVCEKDSLVAGIDPATLYFDDEELDAFIGRDPQSYSDDETEAFRDVLLTMQPADIAPWARSLQTRGISLPIPVRDELLLIVSEARNSQPSL